jgi:mono/diheme cytochrome c family protein
MPAIIASVAVLAACGREAREGERQEAAAAAPAPLQTPTGPVDEALAEHGERVYQAKGCIGCHTLGGGRLSGPDLQGVTDRRAYDWFVPWVMNPDSMLKVDPIAKQLLAEYMTPMLGTGITRDDARALWEYLRHQKN